jgi:uncharacterized repeat protein (TIGR03803 family)
MGIEPAETRAKQNTPTLKENGPVAAVIAQDRAGMFGQTDRPEGLSSSRSLQAVLLAVGALAIGLSAQTARGEVTFTNLVSFTGTNGDSPIGTLVQGRDGDLYGVTQMGGTYGGGTVFKMALDGTFTTLASFDGTNGAGPHLGLVQGADGNFYGTTSSGLNHDQRGVPYGTVFRITPGGSLTTLVSFNGTNGQLPSSELVQGADGDLYGTTQNGGQYNDSFGSGCGTTFRVTCGGALTTLFSFNCTNGAGYWPWCSLSQDADGNFYGMTRGGGNLGYGTIFRMTAAGAVDTLLSFNGTNGSGSFFGLVRGADGNFYGTGELGGAYWRGTVYRVTATGVLTTLASFNGTNGAYVRGMTQASDGNFYGMTAHGGIGYNGQYDSGYGTIFQATPAGALTNLLSFTSDDWPFGGLVQASDGNLYGMTRHGGTYGHGRVFRLAVPMAPVFRPMTQTGSTVALTWSAVAGQRYQVQYATDLGQPNWINLGSPLTATNGTATAFDTVGLDLQRLYHVLLLP